MALFSFQLPPSRRAAAEALAGLLTAVSHCTGCPGDLRRELSTLADDVGGPLPLSMACIAHAIEASYAATLSCSRAPHDSCEVPARAARAMEALRDYAVTAS